MEFIVLPEEERPTMEALLPCSSRKDTSQSPTRFVVENPVTVSDQKGSEDEAT